MPALPNEKHEAFAKHLASGKSASESYTAAGYQACRQNASRLSSHDDVKARVAEIKEARLTEPDMNGRNETNGQFKMGHRGPGRPIGSRNKLTKKFLHDLHSEWDRCGPEVLMQVSKTDPVAFTKIVASVLPAKIDQTLDVTIGLFAEVRDYAEAFRLARGVIGADSPLLIEGEANDMAEGECG